MLENALVLAQISSKVMIAAWLKLGGRGTILFPSGNESNTAEVRAMTRMKQEYPGE